MAKKKHPTVPKKLVLVYNERDLLRFMAAVERLNSLVNDLEALLAEPKRRAEAAAETRRAKASARLHSELAEHANRLPLEADLYPGESALGPKQVPNQDPDPDGQDRQ